MIGDAKAIKAVSVIPTSMNMDAPDSVDTTTADRDGATTAIARDASVPLPSSADKMSSVNWTEGGETNEFGNLMTINSEDVCPYPASATASVNTSYSNSRISSK